MSTKPLPRQNWYTYVQNDPVNYVDLWGLSASNQKNTTGINPNDILFMIMRDTKSYDISTDRDNIKNSYRDSAYLLNKKTGQLVYFDKVQSVANYPSTDANSNPVPSTFNDTVAAGSFGLKVFTETNVASGVAGVIVNASTVLYSTLKDWGIQDDSAIPGVIFEGRFMKDPSSYDNKGNYR